MRKDSRTYTLLSESAHASPPTKTFTRSLEARDLGLPVIFKIVRLTVSFIIMFLKIARGKG